MPATRARVATAKSMFGHADRDRSGWASSRKRWPYKAWAGRRGSPGKSVGAAHPREESVGWNLRDNDEEGVNEDDDAHLARPDRRVRLRKRREEARKQRASGN